MYDDPVNATALATSRPNYSPDEIDPRNHWILEGIEDLNADALDALCSNCEERLSWAQWLNGKAHRPKGRCHGCNLIILSDGHFGPMPRESWEQIQEPGYFDRIWYHVSKDAHWARTVRSAEDGKLLVHAGSKLAALARADDLSRITRAPELYIHSFRLRSTESFSRIVLDDMEDQWQIRLDDPAPMDRCSVEGQSLDRDGISFEAEGDRGAAYYNRFELPGDVSIIFHAQLIQLDTVETVKLERRG